MIYFISQPSKLVNIHSIQIGNTSTCCADRCVLPPLPPPFNSPTVSLLRSEGVLDWDAVHHRHDSVVSGHAILVRPH
jgi:hypothetical protein